MEHKNIEMCDVCQVPIGPSKQTRLVHENGKKHKDRQQQMELVSKRIIIFNYVDPTQIENLKMLLEHECGKVDKIHHSSNGKIVIVKFENEASCIKAVSKPYTFMHRTLKIKRDTLRPFDNPKIIPKKKETCSNEDLELKGDFDQQFHMFIGKIQQPPGDHQKLELLCRHLYETLSNDFPDCRIVPFGSLVTGLSFVGSDVDCFVYLNPNHMESLLEQEEDYDKLHIKLIKITRNRLQKHNKRFTNLFAIPHASVPIVKFFHIPTETNCDISFKGGYGTHNSQLILDLINLDPRIRPIMMFIKYWAKTNDFIGQCGMSSYALCMLVIFFFQTLNPPMLPSVKDLQENEEFNIYIDGWNCGYDRNTLLMFKNKNDSTLLSLLLKFYKFFAEFDFKQNVISTYLGEVVSIEKLKQVENFPSSYNLYAELVNENCARPICDKKRAVYIQDPFEHHRNVSNSITDSRIDHFQASCKFMVDIIEKSIQEKTENQLLRILVTQKIPPLKKKRTKIMSFTLIITENFKEALNCSKEMAIEALETTFEKFLREVLKCNFIDGPKKEEPKAKSTAVWEKDYSFSMPYDLWSERRKARTSLLNRPPDDPILDSIVDSEIMLTEEMIKNAEPGPPKLSVTVAASLNDKCLKVSASPSDPKNNHFQVFYSAFQPKLFGVLLETLKTFKVNAQEIVN